MYIHADSNGNILGMTNTKVQNWEYIPGNIEDLKEGAAYSLINDRLVEVDTSTESDRLFSAVVAHNKSLRKLLDSTDHTVNKYIEAISLGRTPTISEEEYVDLLLTRQSARDTMLDYDVSLGLKTKSELYTAELVSGRVIISNRSSVDLEKAATVRNAVKIKDITNIVVTASTGKVFDGDEKSQDRMVRAINIATITGQTTTDWKLADNTIVEVTLDELKEALALSGQAMSDIWLAR